MDSYRDCCLTCDTSNTPAAAHIKQYRTCCVLCTQRRCCESCGKSGEVKVDAAVAANRINTFTPITAVETPVLEDITSAWALACPKTLKTKNRVDLCCTTTQAAIIAATKCATSAACATKKQHVHQKAWWPRSSSSLSHPERLMSSPASAVGVKVVGRGRTITLRPSPRPPLRSSAAVDPAPGRAAPARNSEATPRATPPNASATLEQSVTSSIATRPCLLQMLLPWLDLDAALLVFRRLTKQLDGEKYGIAWSISRRKERGISTSRGPTKRAWMTESCR